MNSTVSQRLSRIPADVVAARDYEAYAKQYLDNASWTYLHCGAGDETTLRNNLQAYQAWRIHGRVLQDVKGGHTRLDLFGQSYAHPILLAPVAYQQLFHPEGELATALGAATMQTGMVISTLASQTIEEIAAVNQQQAGPRPWFQLYLQAQREHTLALIQRAEKSGCSALAVTVDAPLAGIRNQEQRAGFALPAQIRAVNLPAYQESQSTTLRPGQSIVFDGVMQHAPTWQEIEWLSTVTTLPIILKGILHPADAQQAVACGAAGIIVSNHGGRILDGVLPTLEALPAIVASIDGRIPVLLDGGIRRGSDIFKALALGASAVLIGRPYVYALAAAGALGVAHVIRTLREELEVTMALAGCANLAALDPSYLI